MYYYYYEGQRTSNYITDSSVGDNPRRLFKGLRRWYHINDETSKVDMNINMASKTVRKKHKNIV
jgi:hypothetical protein